MIDRLLRRCALEKCGLGNKLSIPHILMSLHSSEQTCILKWSQVITYPGCWTFFVGLFACLFALMVFPCHIDGSLVVKSKSEFIQVGVRLDCGLGKF